MRLKKRYRPSLMVDTKKIFRDILGILPKPISKILLYLGNWIFQGQIYSSFEEKCYKIVSFMCIYYLLKKSTRHIFNYSSNNSLIFILLAHTVNWLVTTNIHSTRSKRVEKKKYTQSQINNTFTRSTNLIRDEISSQEPISGAAVLGSFARNEAHIESDIDVHIYRKSGFCNAANAYWKLTKIRFKANIFGLPIETWIEKGPVTHSLHPNEVPILITDESKKLSNRFENSIKLENCNYYNIRE